MRDRVKCSGKFVSPLEITRTPNHVVRSFNLWGQVGGAAVHEAKNSGRGKLMKNQLKMDKGDLDTFLGSKTDIDYTNQGYKMRVN